MKIDKIAFLLFPKKKILAILPRKRKHTQECSSHFRFRCTLNRVAVCLIDGAACRVEGRIVRGGGLRAIEWMKDDDLKAFLLHFANKVQCFGNLAL
jgi:hypothetical protein